MRKLVEGSTGEEVKVLYESLVRAGYGDLLKKKDTFDEGMRNALLLFQRANNYEEADPYIPDNYSTVFVEKGPLFDPSGDSSQSNKVKSTIEAGFFTLLGPSETEGRSLIRNAAGNIRGEIPSSRIYKKKAFCHTQTWRRFRMNRNADPDYRTTLSETIKTINPARVVATIKGSFNSMIGQVTYRAGEIRGFIEDTFSSIGMVTNWISGMDRTNYDKITSEDIYIVNLTTTRLIIALPMVPDSVSVNMQSNWSSAIPVGRTAGYHGYNYTSDRTVSFRIELYIRDFTSKEDYQRCINELMALSFPGYESNNVVPPRCYVNLPGQIKFIGYCTNSSPSYDGDLIEGVYSHTSFNLAFTATADVPFSCDDVKTDGVFSVSGLPYSDIGRKIDLTEKGPAESATRLTNF